MNTPNDEWLPKFPKIEVPDTSWATEAVEAIQQQNAERWDREVAAADANVTTAAGIASLVKASEDAEARERTMLRWTIAGVILAGVAAIASIIAIIVTVLVA